jgi:hypothetical protein
MVVGLIEDLPGLACLAALPELSGRLEIKSFTSKISSDPRDRCAYCWGRQYLSALAPVDGENPST